MQHKIENVKDLYKWMDYMKEEGVDMSKCALLLPINPKYIEKIFSGEKKFELRKENVYSALKETDAKMIVIYSTSPVKMIVGYFYVSEIVSGKPIEIWNQYLEDLGVTNEEFKEYYRGKNVGYALKIFDVRKFKEPVDPKEVIMKFKPPQSFRYLDVINIGMIISYGCGYV